MCIGLLQTRLQCFLERASKSFGSETSLFCLKSFLSEALKTLIDAAKPGVSVLSLCEKGDAFVTAETGKVFKKEKEIKKGKNVYENSKFFIILFIKILNC